MGVTERSDNAPRATQFLSPAEVSDAARINPDVEYRTQAPAAVLGAVDFGRPIPASPRPGQ